MSFYTYAIWSDEAKKMYIGQTSDLNRRLFEHKNGLSRWTSSYKDWRLIFSETHASRSEAMKREKYLKTGKGREYVKSKQIVRVKENDQNK